MTDDGWAKLQPYAEALYQAATIHRELSVVAVDCGMGHFLALKRAETELRLAEKAYDFAAYYCGTVG